jgi:riboflavin biosynthesis pyrimidine reductase
VQVVWYTAMSMDGRIADARGRLDFLETIAGRDEALAEFPKFLSGVDGVLLGATTLRWLLDGGHGWPHDDLPTWLLSHDDGLLERVGATRASFRQTSGALAPVLDEIAAAGVSRLWIAGGGNVAAQALALDRIDEVIVTIAPTVLGAGPALFDGDTGPSRTFALEECRALAGNAARLRWVRR